MGLTERIIHEIDHSPLNRGLRGIDWVCDPRNVAVVVGEDEADLILFDWLAPGSYAIHLFLESRGKEAVDAVRAAESIMYRDHDAKMLTAYVPEARKDVAVIARYAGWHYAGTRESNFGPVRVYLTAPETH